MCRNVEEKKPFQACLTVFDENRIQLHTTIELLDELSNQCECTGFIHMEMIAMRWIGFVAVLVLSLWLILMLILLKLK